MRRLKCPGDGSTMHETTRNGVLIDVCPQCRGVWLDRGELDKLLELIYLPDDASVIYEKGKAYKRHRPHLQDFFD